MRTARGQQLEWGLDLGQLFVSCHCLCTLEVTFVILSPVCLRTTVTCHLIVLPFALLLHPPVRDNPPLYLPCLTGLPLTPCALQAPQEKGYFVLNDILKVEPGAFPAVAAAGAAAAAAPVVDNGVLPVVDEVSREGWQGGTAEAGGIGWVLPVVDEVSGEGWQGFAAEGAGWVVLAVAAEEMEGWVLPVVADVTHSLGQWPGYMQARLGAGVRRKGVAACCNHWCRALGRQQGAGEALHIVLRRGKEGRRRGWS